MHSPKIVLLLSILLVGVDAYSFKSSELQQASQECVGSRSKRMTTNETEFDEEGETSIIGGSKVFYISEVPFIAYLQQLDQSKPNAQWSFICTATLISKQAFISTARCVAPFQDNKYKWRVTVGTLTKPNSDAQVYPIDKYFIHSDFSFSPFIVHDIVVLKTKGEVQFGDNVRPICLDNELEIPKTITVYGWGATDFGTGKLHGTRDLMKVDTLYMSGQNCFKGIPVRPSAFCVGRLGQGTCTGDTGAPIVFKGANDKTYLAGMFSNRPGNLQDCIKVRGIATNVREYLNFIDATVETFGTASRDSSKNEEENDIVSGGNIKPSDADDDDDIDAEFPLASDAIRKKDSKEDSKVDSKEDFGGKGDNDGKPENDQPTKDVDQNVDVSIEHSPGKITIHLKQVININLKKDEL